MSEKTKRKGTPIHPYMRLFAAFLPCIGIGILEVVFFLSTGYLCLAFPLSIVALVMIGNLVWKEEFNANDEKPKRDTASQQLLMDPLTLNLEDHSADSDEELLESQNDKTRRYNHDA